MRNLFSSATLILFPSFIPVAALPELVLAVDAPSPSLKVASGNWSHAALLEAPIMKCEKKSNRNTAHVAFQQVRHQPQLNGRMPLTFCGSHNRPLYTKHNRFHRIVQALLQDDPIAQAALLADTISKVQRPTVHVRLSCR